MAKEAAAPFGSAYFSNKTSSPSQQWERDFWTPVMNWRRWFHVRDQDMSGMNHNKVNTVGLFLPGLFGSSSEENLSFQSKSGLLDNSLQLQYGGYIFVEWLCLQGCFWLPNHKWALLLHHQLQSRVLLDYKNKDTNHKSLNNVQLNLDKHCVSME